MKEFYYSKSKYVMFTECHRRLWLEKYKQEEKEESKNQTQLINGNMVGDLAMQLFGDYYLAETKDNDIPQMIKNTQDALLRKEKVICEAAFSYNGCYCAVDILKLEDDNTYSINEVKSSTKVKPSYLKDLAYQYYVLTNLGLKISKTNLIYVNNKYVFKEKLNLNEYFIIEDLTSKIVNLELKYVKQNLELSNAYLNDEENIPIVPMTNKCEEYGGCPFKKYCCKIKGIPQLNSVLELYSCKEKYDYVNKNIIDFEQLISNGIILTEQQKRQVEFALFKNEEDYYINKENISIFLEKLKYPLYFFDFESYQAVIPNLEDTKPYQQIPFQYSLHILHENGKLEHKEFIGNGKDDPRFNLINHMVNDLNESGSIIAYNISFEKTRIKELGIFAPQYSEKLNALLTRFIDLADIFKKGYLYNKSMGGSFSIKSVLPALFPNDVDLNYKNLEQVHKGDEASKIYLELANMESDDYNKTVNNLLAYCKLDTYAMVKIYEKILGLIKS